MDTAEVGDNTWHDHPAICQLMFHLERGETPKGKKKIRC